MKHYTTIEQSKKLVELGLNPDTADMHIVNQNYGDHGCFEIGLEYHAWDACHVDGYIPCWSLGALLDIINNNNLVYDISNDKHRDFEILVYRAYYIEQKLKFYHNEHTIVDMIVWLLKNGYIKTEKL